MTEAYLVSAYDLYYKHLPTPVDFPFTPELIVVDSGGYEVSQDRDYSDVLDPLPAPEPWEPSKLQEVLDRWPNEIPAVFVSYDAPGERKVFAEQAQSARQLLSRYPQHLHLLLLKPETEKQTLLKKTLKAAVAAIEELTTFDVLGVTEKELGRSMLDRMAEIARLRLALDEAGLKMPIHVFGALDPLSCYLYFISGAEIFDGLTWIRYAYDDGRCLYTHNLGPLKYGLHCRDDVLRARTMAENYYELQKLQHRMRDFETTQNFEKLAPHSRFLKDAWDSLRTQLRGRL